MLNIYFMYFSNVAKYALAASNGTISKCSPKVAREEY